MAKNHEVSFLMRGNDAREANALSLAGLRLLLQQFPSVSAVLLLAGVMIMATVVSTAILLLDLRHEELVHAKGEVVTLTRVLSDQTARSFEGVSLTLHGIRDRLSDGVGRSLELDGARVRTLLQLRSAGFPQVKSIFVVDASGRGVNSSRPDFIPRLDVSEREFFRRFADGGSDEIFISRPETARVDGQWTFYVSMRLSDAGGRLRGVLVAAIDIGYFESLYGSVKLDFVSRIQLLDLDGVLMAGKPYGSQEFARAPAQPAWFTNLRALSPGNIVEGTEPSAQGGSLVAYRRAGLFPLVMRVAIDENEALAPWRRVMRPIVGGAVAMLFFVLTTAFLMVRNLLRKEMLETALKEGDEQLRSMVQSVEDAIVTVNQEKRVVLFNSAAERMFDVPAGEAIGRDLATTLARSIPPVQLDKLLRQLDAGRCVGNGQDLHCDVDLVRQGKEIPVELSLSESIYRGEKLMTAIFRDLTERKRSECELLESNRQLQSLSASLQNYREEERARIARELHDELGQLLTGIRMEVSWLGGRLQPEQGVLQDKVASVKGQIDQTIATVRRISSELRPLALDDLGFAAAASWYVDQFAARTGLAVDLSLPDIDPERGDAVATALFRVLQESLTNVARHARATRADVCLRLENGAWVLQVRDDGSGFVPEPGKGGNIGLVGMRERAQNLGGRFSVTSASGQGTLIEIVIPAKQPQGEVQWKN